MKEGKRERRKEEKGGKGGKNLPISLSPEINSWLWPVMALLAVA